MKAMKILALSFLIFAPALLASDHFYLVKIDFSRARLFLLDENLNTLADFPVALPAIVPKLPQEGRILEIEKDPRWFPTPATRESYFKKNGKELPRIIKAGDPRNAMGAAKIKIEFRTSGIHPAIVIHGTNEPGSIGQKVTRGCIRMFNKDILKLIEIIKDRATEVIFTS